MTEPQRTDSAKTPTSDDAERATRIEELLVSGLDHYFAAEYEQAINIWTRVVFLERDHDRARAYIDRARTAIAERQRESEELLAPRPGCLQDRRRRARTGSADARRRSGCAERPGARAARADGSPRRHRALTRRSIGGRCRRRVWSERDDPDRRSVDMAVGDCRGRGVEHCGRGLLRRRPRTVMARGRSRGDADSRADHRRAAANRSHGRHRCWITRASCTAGGHLHDALRLLDRIGIADPVRADADRLRADIQRDAACCRIGRNARDNGYGDAPVKCPKCDYLGFETGDRCKNCGYDFSLLSVADSDPPDYDIYPAAVDDVPVHVIDDMGRHD